MFIAEPPLYRVDNKKNPFVINKQDYIDRYVQAASKDYKLGYQRAEDDPEKIKYLNKASWFEFLDNTNTYVDDMRLMVDHYKVNDRLLEFVLEEFAINGFDPSGNYRSQINQIDMDHLMYRINDEFPEVYYDRKTNLIKGVIDAKYQSIEITEALVRKGKNLICTIEKWMPDIQGGLVLKAIKTGSEYRLSLLGVLKILKKYQPEIFHRFKGLGENSARDLKETIMDPNTRTLIKVQISDIENDMAVFQMLRGGNPSDVAARRALLKDFEIDRSMIDT